VNLYLYFLALTSTLAPCLSRYSSKVASMRSGVYFEAKSVPEENPSENSISSFFGSGASSFPNRLSGGSPPSYR
jgi:hypothetical protein